MKVLVTGGAGFLGAHLTRGLVDAGHDVVVFDKATVPSLPLPAEAEHVTGSVTDVEAVRKLFEGRRFGGIYHLAAFAAEGISHAVKELNYATNVMGSINVINEALRAEAKIFCFASSVAVYGNIETPMREDRVPSPIDSYGNGKLAIERELEITMRLQGMPFIAFRMQNVYGEGQSMSDLYRNAVARFLNQILRHEPITVYGDGTQTRAFTYVADVSPRLVAATSRPDCWGTVYNIGSASPISVNELADATRRAMGVPDHPIRHLPARHEPAAAFMDTSRVRAAFGDWRDTALHEGLRRTAAWARLAGPRAFSSDVNIEVPFGSRAEWIG